MRDRKGLIRMGGRFREVEGGEPIIRIYYMGENLF